MFEPEFARIIVYAHECLFAELHALSIDPAYIDCEHIDRAHIDC